ncbi:ribosome-inactivating protein [Tanacetum coccineum]
MLAEEAVKIRHIYHLILRNMYGQNQNFIPDPRAISMENGWSPISKQIQWSGPMRQAALALMLYQCNPNAIRMPDPVADVGVDDEHCPYGEPTTNIIGKDGQCVDVKNNQYNNGDPIILWACGNAQRKQLWTFKSDGTIRSNGKCLTTYGYASGSYIMIFDCDTAMPKATKWILYNAGKLGMCLQANDTNAHVWLANYVLGTEPSLDCIILLKCQGWGDQRWTFMADDTILIPNAWLVMDVQNTDSVNSFLTPDPTTFPCHYKSTTDCDDFSLPNTPATADNIHNQTLPIAKPESTQPSQYHIEASNTQYSTAIPSRKSTRTTTLTLKLKYFVLNPVNFKEAIADSDWCKAMDVRLQDLEKNGTWELPHLPPGKKEIGSHWIYKTKLKADGA